MWYGGLPTFLPQRPPMPPAWELDLGPNPRGKGTRAKERDIKRMECALDKLLDDVIYVEEEKFMRHLIRQVKLYGVEVLTADWSVLIEFSCFLRQYLFILCYIFAQGR